MRRRSTVGLWSLVLCLALSTPAVTQDTTEEPAGGPTALWRVEPGGTLLRVSLSDGAAERPPAGSVPAVSAVEGPVGDRLYALTPSDDRTSTLLAIALPSFEIAGRWELRGAAARLLLSPSGDLACVPVTRPGGAWSLVVVDLVQGQVKPGMQLAYEPQAMALIPDGTAPRGVRLVIAAQDRLASFTLDPPTPSWFFKSPGRHHAVAHLAAAGSGALVALRDESLVVIDPSRRVRIEGRVRLTDDDATTLVPLPAAGWQMAVRSDLEMAAVLLADRRTIAWVDLKSGRVMQTRELPAPSELNDRGGTLVLAGLEEHAGRVSLERADPPERVPEPDPPPIARSEPEPPPPPPPSAEPATSSPPDPSTSMPPAKEPAAAAPPPEPVIPEPVTGPALSGRLTGEALGLEVRLYGPNNILKLHARIPVAPGGEWRAPLPPPGTYRVVVGAGPGAHVFTRPEFRTIAVGTAGLSVEGVDFEVRGGL